jgi:hypothetical protein
MRENCAHFPARIPLQVIGIDHVHDSGSIGSKIIVIEERHCARREGPRRKGYMQLVGTMEDIADHKGTQ